MDNRKNYYIQVQGVRQMDFKDMELEDWVEYLANVRVLYHDVLGSEEELAFSEFLENAEAERVGYRFDSEEEDEYSLYNEIYEAVEEEIERVAKYEKSHLHWEEYKEYVDAGEELSENYSDEEDMWD